MGELEDYYVIESEVHYAEDPWFSGRIKCDIPGVISHETTMLEAMPWVRPLRMGAYQTFSRPLVGEKVWVLASKTNYNEFWWTYFHETIEIVQKFLDEYYDKQPDVFHARNTCSGDVISTFDDDRGYYTNIGDDFINWKMNREMKISFNDCRVMIEGNKQYSGGTDDTSIYEPAVKGYHCQAHRSKMIDWHKQLAEAALADRCPNLFKKHLEVAAYYAETIKDNQFLCKYHYVS